MDAPSRYSSPAGEAGMEGGVLKNKFNIKDQIKLENNEAILYLDAKEHFLGPDAKIPKIIDVSFLLKIHQYFLEPLYTWAGKIRTVNISKGDAMFCSANFIGSALADFDLVLKKNTPNQSDTKQEVATKLAVIHCELNAIHPFREGNGRTIRLFLDVLITRLGYQQIAWNKNNQKSYIQACILGMNQDYAPMSRVIRAGLVKNRQTKTAA